eukprot:jgi/Phyca11/19893/fgenesh1_pg.PHYCAscaffold_53_\
MAPEPADKWVFSELRSVILKSRHNAAASTAEKENVDASVFHTPSFTESNVPWSVEQQLRRTTCTFVEHLAQLLEMPEAPSISAQLFIQRFYMMHSFKTHDRFLVATAALFLAGKTEEFPVKVRYVTECSIRSSSPAVPAAKKQKLDSKGKPVEMSATLGNDKEAANTKHIEWLNALLEVVEVGEVEANSSKVLLLERILLLTLSFEIGPPQPFAYIAPHMERVFALEAMHPDISYEDIRQVTFMLVADAVKSGLILAFDCVAIAAGAVYLACLYRHQVGSNVATEKNEPWWVVLQLPEKELEDVASCYLWMYQDENGDKMKGLGPEFLDLWTRYRPSDNRPDLEYVKALDAVIKTP